MRGDLIRDYGELSVLYSMEFWRNLSEVIINVTIGTPRGIETESVWKRMLFIFIVRRP